MPLHDADKDYLESHFAKTSDAHKVQEQEFVIDSTGHVHQVDERHFLQ